MSDRSGSTRISLRVASLALLLLAIGCDSVLPKRTEGEKLYRKHCAECHGVDGAGNTIRSMADSNTDLLDDSWRHTTGVSGVQEVLAQDLVFKHPTFSRRLTSKEIRAIAGHVYVLRGERRP